MKLKPNRKPDFIWKVHEFWLEPEMICHNGQNDAFESLVEIDEILHYVWHPKHLPDKMKQEIQLLYQEFKVEQILLTDSKSD